MQGGQFPESSYSVAEKFADETVKLQRIHRQRAHSRGNLEEDVFGGYVRSYGFNYVQDSNIAQGMMWIGFSGGRWSPLPVTVVLLGATREDGKIGQRIVEKTAKLSESSDLVLDAYFSTYCKQLGRYVVVYEQFDGPFFEGNTPQDIAGNFFGDLLRYRLNPFWVEKIRSLMDLLEHGRARSVTHGGLADPGSYVLSGQTVKLINVGREVAGHVVLKDLMDLRRFIKMDNYFNGNASAEWLTLDMLLGSHLVTRFNPGWKNVVVGHPMLLGSDVDIIAAFDGVYTSMGKLSSIKATRLANLLYRKFPGFYDERSIRNPRGPNDHHNNLRSSFPPNSVVFDGLFEYTYQGDPQLYGGDKIYLEIIRLARNCIHHAKDYDEILIDPEEMLMFMRANFNNYISTTYSLLHMVDDPGRIDGPYECDDKKKPSTSTMGDYFSVAFSKAKQSKKGRGRIGG
ncbi:uncharacterized protein LOC119305189 isoform X1 [Triticum dicoccoides]|uniref:uncharacterized protein LOC119305189 isoform X1 n=1 Tax=Triticum dicoccoides TaxID=85692 RepID=UPI001890247C|nr:uncharacterized protein LOC119305189 isoform X1 [Triticum dicoccoides]